MLQDLLGSEAMAYPLKQAVRCDDVTLTYRELYRMKEGMKRYLVESMSLQHGDKIAFHLPNCADFIYSFFAAAEIGAVTVPLNTHFKESELRFYTGECGIKAVITHGDLVGHWGEMPWEEGGPAFVIIDRLQLPLVDSGARFPSRGIAVSDDAEILYLCTSGSSGRPKIIPKRYALLLAGAENLGSALEVDRDDRFLCVTPLFHANGFENSMFLPLVRGASIVLMREFSPRKLLDMLTYDAVTILIGSPFIFSSLCDCADRTYRFSSMRHCLSAGAPLPIELKKKFYDLFGVRVREHYGASETGPISVQFHDIDEIGSVGRPLQNVQVRILDDRGATVAPGVLGEVFVSSTSMVTGYLNEPELNREAFQGGFFRTGDVGMLDSEGNLHITGRKKAIINVSGIKIDPAEIRNVLVSHPKVRDAYVTGVRNKRGMEVVKAIIVAHPDCTARDVVTFCKERLADFKIPRIIEFRDSIPIDAMGKVIRSLIHP